VSDDLSIPNPGYRGNRAGRYGTGATRVRQGMDPDTRRLMMFAGGLGAVLVVLVGASTLMGRHSGEIPVVSADPRPIREKPLNPGGMKIDGAENDVFSGGTDTGNARLAAAPESPDTKALRTAGAPPPPAAEESPAAAAVAPAPPPAPVTKPAVVASAPPVAKPAPAKPVVAAAETHPAAAKPAVAAAETHPATPGHQLMVQLAALATEDAARAEWTQLARKMPDLLNGKEPNYSRIERDGHTFWRVRTSGFTDVAQARAFCDHVRAKGGGCSVADF
jgi:SPOR domain